MQKILVVSDSHHKTDALKKVLARHLDVDYIFHCGDFSKDGLLEDEKCIMVKGNCDYHDLPSEQLVKINDYFKIFITHGHLYNVKSGLGNLYFKALEVGANVVCFGHSHIPTLFKEDNIYFFNPGSVFANSVQRGSTYGMIKIIGDYIDIVHLDVETGVRIAQTIKN